MLRENQKRFQFDWVIIALFLCLLTFGYFNIISASKEAEIIEYFNISKVYGKHLLFMGVAVLFIVLILSLEAKFYERFASITYVIAIILLLGLFVFGKDVNGARSWYGIGSITIQPSEFAKVATALAVAKFISDLQTNIKALKDQIQAALIIFIPALLILLQNDAGSTLIYLAFFFVFYREGIQNIYLIIFISLIILAILSLKFGILVTSVIVALLVFGAYILRKRKRYSFLVYASLYILAIGFPLGVKGFYTHVLKEHQKHRISLWLRLEKDPEKLEKMKRSEAYNLLQSEEAISSGGWTGKGYLEGTRTTGKFVPEQHTDYIFSTVGEEWGFFGSSFVVILFMLLILRILYLAEKQKTQFSRVYGYSVASILFLHFTINIGMVMGLIPTVGIPLPFFSYGGSGLLAFTILLFVFVKLDSNRINEW